MSKWPSTKAHRVYAALLKIGWKPKSTKGSHRKLVHPSFPYSYTFPWHDSEELGHTALKKIAAKTGLKESDL